MAAIVEDLVKGELLQLNSPRMKKNFKVKVIFYQLNQKMPGLNIT